MYGCGGNSAVQPHSMGGVMGGRRGTHTHTHTQEHTQEHTHTQERTRKCWATYPLKSAGFMPERGRFDENGENDEFAFYPLKTRASLLRPPKTMK